MSATNGYPMLFAPVAVPLVDSLVGGCRSFARIHGYPSSGIYVSSPSQTGLLYSGQKPSDR